MKQPEEFNSSAGSLGRGEPQAVLAFDLIAAVDREFNLTAAMRLSQLRQRYIMHS